jgi:nitronate monooxygenase
MGGGLTTPQLVAAVSNAGGLGILGATGFSSSEQLRKQIHQIKSLISDRNTLFGINFLLVEHSPMKEGLAIEKLQQVQKVLDVFRKDLGIQPHLNQHENIDAATTTLPQLPSNLIPSKTSSISELIDIVFEEAVPVLSFGLGIPSRKYVQEAHSLGMKVTAMATTVDEALSLRDIGVDAIVAQGSEAGGHRSTFEVKRKEEGDHDDTHHYDNNKELPLVGTLALVPQVVDALKRLEEESATPAPLVIAAGGIMDGRGIAASLSLGAQAVQLGTRFLVATESGAFPGYKELLLKAKETDTTITRAFTGMPARCIKNYFIDKFDKSKVNPLPWPIQDKAADDIYEAAKKKGNSQYAPSYAGQGLRLLEKKKRRNEQQHQQQKEQGQRNQQQSAKEIVEELVIETIATINAIINLISRI